MRHPGLPGAGRRWPWSRVPTEMGPVSEMQLLDVGVRKAPQMQRPSIRGRPQRGQSLQLCEDSPGWERRGHPATLSPLQVPGSL